MQVHPIERYALFMFHFRGIQPLKYYTSLKIEKKNAEFCKTINIFGYVMLLTPTALHLAPQGLPAFGLLIPIHMMYMNSEGKDKLVRVVSDWITASKGQLQTDTSTHPL